MSDGLSVSEETGICITRFYDRGTETPDPKANAKLYARAPELLRRLVDALRERDELIVHMHVHSGYKDNGYLQMTTPQKELYDAIWNRSVKELDDEERNSD